MKHSEKISSHHEIPDHYTPRDLSWLEFNARVLEEGLDPAVPLGERLKFLGIFSSNLDEFFRVRVAGLMHLLEQHDRNIIPGTTPKKLLADISRRAHELVQIQCEGIQNTLNELTSHGVRFIHYADIPDKQTYGLQSYFSENISPILTPLGIDELPILPLLLENTIYVALQLKKCTSNECTSSEKAPVNNGNVKSSRKQCKTCSSKKNEDNTAKKIESHDEYRLAVLAVPPQLSRFSVVPGNGDMLELTSVEEVIAHNAHRMFPGSEIISYSLFRITRDADIEIREVEVNMPQEVRNAVNQRKRRAAVRLEISANSSSWLKHRLMLLLDVQKLSVYEIFPLLDARALMELANLNALSSTLYETWAPVQPRDLLDEDDIFTAASDHDILLFHPYEQFNPVVTLLQRAAQDPDVLAIKQTLYRTSGNSPIVAALMQAARNGKEVVALVELKARFDEERNVRWAEKLEDAGCHVIYGVAGLKTHAKALLIVRREKGRIQRYVHLATGNYNDRTARIYSDLGLITTERDITADIAAFFNLVTGYSDVVGWNRLTVEPVRLKRRFLEMIEREIDISTALQPGMISMKLNSLEDPDMIAALYRASCAGVHIRINVRGICCLRPGIPGVSENITVRSIIDRFLEHSRIFYFHNGGHPEIYLASADWMTRNLERRLEVIFPILSPALKRRVEHILDIYFSDNVKSRSLRPDGTWERLLPEKGATLIRAQEVLYQEAVSASVRTAQPPLRYVPLEHPEKD